MRKLLESAADNFINIYGAQRTKYTYNITEKSYKIYFQILGPREPLKERFKSSGIMTVAWLYIFINIIYIHNNMRAHKQFKNFQNISTSHSDKLVLSSFKLDKLLSSFLGVGISYQF